VLTILQYAGDKHDPALIIGSGDPEFKEKSQHVTEIPPMYDGAAVEQAEYMDHENVPTEEELHTLRRVPDHIPWKVYTIATVELLERLSFYGTTQVSLIVHFLQSS
jgi:proton-dependent oligopeptide transporter, POT family